MRTSPLNTSVWVSSLILRVRLPSMRSTPFGKVSTTCTVMRVCSVPARAVLPCVFDSVLPDAPSSGQRKFSRGPTPAVVDADSDFCTAVLARAEAVVFSTTTMVTKSPTRRALKSSYRLPARSSHSEPVGGGISGSSESVSMATPSLRFPLQARGTAWVRGSVPLAKRAELNPPTVPLARRAEPNPPTVLPARRAEPKGGGQWMNPKRAIGVREGGRFIPVRKISEACKRSMSTCGQISRFIIKHSVQIAMFIALPPVRLCQQSVRGASSGFRGCRQGWSRRVRLWRGRRL
jgi:hypothetical protein